LSIGDLLVAVGAFVAAFVIDAGHAAYVRAVANRRAGHAAAASVVVYVAGILGWVSLIKVGWWVALPEVAGLALGSYWSVWRQPKT
jgi:hypothetical protein